ncbi:acyloxyacyl hydrolase [Immundisolibacter sp.]|uniref:acyloxyacyl hydrolase n=1 Tax=Immundisolibacter sp. TaxID=1934948 RepID=UPI0035697F9C
MLDIARNVFAGLGLCAALAAPACAQYRTELSTGWGNDNTRLLRLGVARDWQQTWFTDGNWQLSGHWLAEIGYWNSDERNRQNDNLWEVALTPVLRLAPKATTGLRPYLEAGVGGHLLSETRIGERKLSTAWQFGSHIGTGVNCGQFAIGYRFQHLSNASIKRPNDGIDFHMLTASMAF